MYLGPTRLYLVSSLASGLVVTALGCGGQPSRLPTDASSGPDDAATSTSGSGPAVTGTGEAGETTSGTTSATTGTATTVAPDPCVLHRDEVRAILKERCAGCHSGEAAQVFDYVEDLERLVEEVKVEPGDPEGSILYQMIESGAMPLQGAPLSEGEQQGIYEWIARCAAPVDCTDNEFIPRDAMLAEMRHDVEARVEIAARPFVRYFTLTHLHNAGLCDRQIDVYRHALVKLLNSLSADSFLHPLEPIDPAQLIFRIDLRDYGWESADVLPNVWDTLVAANPFAVEYFGQEADLLKLATQTAVPFQTADWFIADASQAPLYDEIMYERVFAVTDDITTMNRAELEAFLEVDVAGDVAETLAGGKRVARAGFKHSGVSENYRIIERHKDTKTSGPYWISHDFIDKLGTANIFQHPLDFEADGGEIIWTMRNGLQAYMLVDRDGLRIDVADPTIVFDRDNDAPIRNGMACMSCHAQGMRAAVDEVGPYVIGSFGEFDEEVKQQVEHIYPDDQTGFAPLLAADKERFISSMKAMTEPLLINGLEAIGVAARAFEDDPVDLRRLAAELGVSEEMLRPALAKLPADLRMVDSQPVSRAAVRANFSAAVCALKLGVSKVCL